MLKILILLIAVILIAAIGWWFFGHHQERAMTARLNDNGQDQKIRIEVNGGYSPLTRGAVDSSVQFRRVGGLRSSRMARGRGVMVAASVISFWKRMAISVMPIVARGRTAARSPGR